MSHFAEVIDSYRNQSHSEADKGRRFERLLQTMLRTVPPYSDELQEVNSWARTTNLSKKHTAMKMKIFFAGVAICAASAAAAQSAVVPTGGKAAGGGYALSYTVGQVAAATAAAEGFSLTEGVQQPTAVEVEQIEVEDALPEVSVYPNPTTAMVTLKRESADATTNVTLFDGSGRVLAVQTWGDEQMTLDLTSQPSGVYVVRVAYGNNRMKNYKIIKRPVGGIKPVHI